MTTFTVESMTALVAAAIAGGYNVDGTAVRLTTHRETAAPDTLWVTATGADGRPFGTFTVNVEDAA